MGHDGQLDEEPTIVELLESTTSVATQDEEESQFPLHERTASSNIETREELAMNREFADFVEEIDNDITSSEIQLSNLENTELAETAIQDIDMVKESDDLSLEEIYITNEEHSENVPIEDIINGIEEKTETELNGVAETCNADDDATDAFVSSILTKDDDIMEPESVEEANVISKEDYEAEILLEETLNVNESQIDNSTGGDNTELDVLLETIVSGEEEYLNTFAVELDNDKATMTVEETEVVDNINNLENLNLDDKITDNNELLESDVVNEDNNEDNSIIMAEVTLEEPINDASLDNITGDDKIEVDFLMETVVADEDEASNSIAIESDNDKATMTVEDIEAVDGDFENLTVDIADDGLLQPDVVNQDINENTTILLNEDNNWENLPDDIKEPLPESMSGETFESDEANDLSVTIEVTLQENNSPQGDNIENCDVIEELTVQTNADLDVIDESGNVIELSAADVEQNDCISETAAELANDLAEELPDARMDSELLDGEITDKLLAISIEVDENLCTEEENIKDASSDIGIEISVQEDVLNDVEDEKGQDVKEDEDKIDLETVNETFLGNDETTDYNDFKSENLITEFDDVTNVNPENLEIEDEKVTYEENEIISAIDEENAGNSSDATQDGNFFTNLEETLADTKQQTELLSSAENEGNLDENDGQSELLIQEQNTEISSEENEGNIEEDGEKSEELVTQEENETNQGAEDLDASLSATENEPIDDSATNPRKCHATEATTAISQCTENNTPTTIDANVNEEKSNIYEQEVTNDEEEEIWHKLKMDIDIEEEQEKENNVDDIQTCADSDLQAQNNLEELATENDVTQDSLENPSCENDLMPVEIVDQEQKDEIHEKITGEYEVCNNQDDLSKPDVNGNEEVLLVNKNDIESSNEMDEIKSETLNNGESVEEIQLLQSFSTSNNESLGLTDLVSPEEIVNDDENQIVKNDVDDEPFSNGESVEKIEILQSYEIDNHSEITVALPKDSEEKINKEDTNPTVGSDLTVIESESKVV